MQLSSKLEISALISITFTHHHDPKENFPCPVVLLEISFCYQGSYLRLTQYKCVSSDRNGFWDLCILVPSATRLKMSAIFVFSATRR